MHVTKMPYYQNACYKDALLPKCLLPKCPITETSYYRNVQLLKCPFTEMSINKVSFTKVSFTKMSGYRFTPPSVSNASNHHHMPGVVTKQTLPHGDLQFIYRLHQTTSENTADFGVTLTPREIETGTVASVPPGDSCHSCFLSGVRWWFEKTNYFSIL